ncbi:hypothetical protein NHQ30_008877 [Ciborinia camelliae]|nr:hypothetical protein NHQ30_008877 [Ciborinia camelliae]
MTNQEDAHIWRSQTLRLQLPPIDNESSEDEKWLHNTTENMIAGVANQQALNFLEGPARYLMGNEAGAECIDTLKAIYQEAATMSYMLWTRRTTLVCCTLKGQGGRPVFNPDSTDMIAQTSVAYEQHVDQLKGKPISIMVHPLVKVFGTDDAKDYDKGRVWAPAEVWLDSRLPSAK